MNNINLDINSYTINELENLLKLQNNSNYTKEDVFNSKNKLRNNIIQSNISQIKKEELLIFLDNIYNKLVNNSEKVDDSKFNNVKQYDGNHFVISNKNNDYSSTLENNKKINKSIIKRTYTIDSLFRQNYIEYKSHNYILNLPETITKAITMSISSLEIPLTYYNISKELNNNVFHIELIEKTSGDKLIVKIELEDAFYSTHYRASNSQTINYDIESNSNEQKVETLIKFAINKKIQSLTISDIINISPSLDARKNDYISDLSNNLSFDIVQKSCKSNFKFDSNVNNIFIDNSWDLLINFDVNNDYRDSVYVDNVNKVCLNNEFYQKLGWMLGFRRKKISLKSNQSSSNLRISKSNSICYINYPRYLYVAIDDFQSSSRNYFSIAADSIVAPNIVGRINILNLTEDKGPIAQGASPGDFLYNQKFIREYFGPTDINKLKIQLLDEYGRAFSLNNVDWSFVLSFECFYN
jgi:hypothetical protein